MIRNYLQRLLNRRQLRRIFRQIRKGLSNV
jgi:hypothetical protein